MTTKTYTDPQRPREEYQHRVKIEGRHRMFKCFHDLSDFHSRNLNTITAQVVFILLSYTLSQWQLWNRRQEELSGLSPGLMRPELQAPKVFSSRWAALTDRIPPRTPIHPMNSRSSLRFIPGIQDLLKNEALGEIVGAATWGSCTYQPGTPDMFFYGIHGIEPLYALMGTGCETVTRVQTANTDVVSGVWKGGRVGTYRGIRKNKAEFGAIAFGTKAIVPAGREGGYQELCKEIGRFFKTRAVPVAPEETIEIFAFMEAADESKRRGGEPVFLASVLAKARAEVAAKLAK